MDVFTVENRLPVIFETREDTGVVAAQVWVKVGSKYEDLRMAGITHFIEHLIFKGTEKVKANEMASRIEALGGSINAFTSYDNTVYHIVIPKNAFEEGLVLLLDAVKNPAFPEEEIVKERQVVLEEIKMGEDDPQRKLFKELFSVSYDGHPYGRPIIGFEETVRKVSPEDIRMYFREHYTPDNMAIVITGDFDREKTREILAAYVRGYDDQKAKPFVVSRRKEKGSEKAKVVERNVRESYIAISYPVPPVMDDDTPSIEILAKILGEGDSSRLQEQLKFKKGMVTNISTYLFSPKEEGLFIIIATFNGKTFDGITKAIDDEIARLAKDGPTVLEIEKAKNMIRASYVYGAETAQGRARQIGNYQTLTGDPRYPDHYLKALGRVGADDVVRVLKKYITAKEKKLAALLPNNTFNPHTYKLKNGLTYVVNNNKASPSFSFRLGFVGGLKEEPPGKNGMFNVLSRMLLKGTKTKDAAAIAREIDCLAGDISPYSGRNIFGLSGKFLSKDMKAAFTLLHELVTSTSMKAADLEKVKGDVLSGIRQRDDDPIGSTFRKFNEVLYQGHPYGKDPMGTEDNVRNMTAKDVEDSYKQYVSPANAVLAVSGDLDDGDLRKLLDELFAKWQGPANVLRKTSVAPRKQDVGVDREMMQSHLIFGFLGPGLLEGDRYAVEVLDAILSGMGGRIHKVLREENPYAYAVTFFNQMAYEVGGIGIYIGTDRKLVKEVEGISKAEVERIIREGFTDREVEDGKAYLIGNHYISMQSNSAISTSMCLDTMYGLKPNYFKVWPSHIEKVTKEDVNRVAKKYLSLDKMVYVRVGAKE
jgi:zinc protease